MIKYYNVRLCLKKAQKKDGKSMRYYLAIDIGASSGRHIVAYLQDGKMITGKDNLLKIAEKLGKMGYYAPVEIPNNRDDLAVLTLHVTEEDLKNFPEDKDNGYFFFLFKEDDMVGSWPDKTE